MINVLLADDHNLITDGISKLLENESDIEVVSICHDGEEVFERLKEYEVHVALLDIDMPKMNGLQCAEKILTEYPGVKVAMLTMHEEKALIQRCIEMGIGGYFLKTIKKEELIRAIHSIIEHGEYFPSDVTKALVTKEKISPSVTQSPLLSELSERELEIIRLIASGMANKEIAEALFISPRTVDTHRTNIMNKLDIHNVAGLVRFAFQNKLVE